MPSWLLTGTSRGIGLGLVEHLLKKDESNFVIATARDITTPGLTDLASRYPKERLRLVKLDVANPENVQEAVTEATELLPEGLDYLLHNAGVHLQPTTKFEDIDLEYFEEELRFNTVVPIRLTRAFLPVVKASREKKVIFVTSAMGSFERSYPAINQCNVYSVGKAAMNMVGRKWAASLQYEAVPVGIIHPGWVDTAIGAPLVPFMEKNAPEIKQIPMSECVSGVIKVCEEAVILEKTGTFWNYDGTIVPW